MNKFNLDLKISEKDKKLLLILLAFVILTCAYYLGYKNLTDLTQKYNQEASTLKKKQTDLVQKNSNREKFISDTNNYKNTYNLIFSNYSNGTSQDASLAFISKLEMITGSWIKSTTLSDTSMIYTFGNDNSTNPSASGLKVYSTDMQGYKTTLTLTYEAKYDQWKNLIKFVNNYYSKNSIDSIAMSYNAVTGLVSGTMTLSTYAITGSQRPFTAPKIDSSTGTDNIFSSNAFDSSKSDLIDENGEYILSEYDYFILLNASTSDVDSCIIGKKDDASRESIISANSNTTEGVTVRVAGSVGNYTIQYKIGNTTYPAANYNNGVSFTPGNTLDLLIMSSSRVSNSDLSTIKLNIVNDSDMTLNVKVCNDDSKNPRVKYEGKAGSVNIYN